MPTALSDPSTTLYIALIIVVALLALLWMRSRKRNDLIRLLIGGAALLAVFLIDRFVESPREEASRKVEEMAKATETRNWDGVFNHISDSFLYKGPTGTVMDKKTFREKVKGVEKFAEFKGVAVWDLHRADHRIVNENNFTIGFRAQASGIPPSQSFIIAAFTKDPDGQWRMSNFTRYNFAKRENGPPETIPGLD